MSDRSGPDNKITNTSDVVRMFSHDRALDKIHVDPDGTIVRPERVGFFIDQLSLNGISIKKSIKNRGGQSIQVINSLNNDDIVAAANAAKEAQDLGTMTELMKLYVLHKLYRQFADNRLEHDKRGITMDDMTSAYFSVTEALFKQFDELEKKDPVATEQIKSLYSEKVAPDLNDIFVSCIGAAAERTR